MSKYLIFSAVFLFACSKDTKYSPSKFYDTEQQSILLTNIVTYIFDAPPSTLLKDRFKPEHKAYYETVKDRFSLEELFVDAEGTHYYLVLRPAARAGELRGAGGTFRVDKALNLIEFREAFVTPILPATEAKEKSIFLFDKMVKGQLADYFKMKTYVQWPNEISYYDTVVYQWKLKKEMAQ